MSTERKTESEQGPAVLGLVGSTVGLSPTTISEERIGRPLRPWRRCCMDAECGIVVNSGNSEGIIFDSSSCSRVTLVAVTASDYDRDEYKNLDPAGCIQAERTLMPVL